MSARDLLLNGAALRGVLAAQGRQVAAARRRARWPGGTRFTTGSGSLTPETLPWFTEAVVNTLELDRGTWLLVGTAEFEYDMVSGVEWEAYLRFIEAGFPGSNYCRDRNISGEAPAIHRWEMTVYMLATFTEPATVELGAEFSRASGVATCTYSSSILGYPL